MLFLEPTLENFQKHISKLKQDKQPLWGTLTAQGMVEHLSDWIDLTMGKGGDLKLEIPEDKVAKAQAFLFSEYPLPKNFQAKFFPISENFRNMDLESAIAEFENKWNELEAFFIKNPDFSTMHPSFGVLDYKQLMALHSKHLTHHFEQFELI
ncbi:MAG: hypothetical protein ACJASQ_003435 [Crocinitomicaceae bacterium]|jgi:oxepin-CoA hydrolase/3-oxo-5,6-dehydrosuberyl-CoA semialdehyde dehydrogenase